MKVLVLFLATVAFAGPAFSRESHVYDIPLSGEDYQGDLELAFDDGEFEYWGTAPSWADEEQVGFIGPDGGPWHIEIVRLWVAGNLPHAIIFREAPQTVWNPPGDIIDDSIIFLPGYPVAPDHWVEVNVASLGLVLVDGEGIFVGVALDGLDDGIGLESSDPDGHSWGLYDGQWQDDTNDWGVDVGIRLVVTGMITSKKATTWGAVRSLFH